MKALVFDRPGTAAQVLRIADAAEPALGPEDVLVGVKASAVMQSDYLYIEGRYRWKPVFPQIAGLEGVGEIIAIGENVDPLLGLTVGTRVVFRHAGGAWAECVGVHASEALPLPPGVDWFEASQLFLNPLTANGLLDSALIEPERPVMSNAGTSAISHWLAVLSRRRGIRYFCSVRDPAGRARAPRAAERVFVEGDEYGTGLGAFFDAVGGESARRGIDALGTGGKFVAYGRLSEAPISLGTDALIYRGIRMEGFGFQAWYHQQSRERVVHLLQEAAALWQSDDLDLGHSPVFSILEFGKALRKRERIVFSLPRTNS